MATAIISRPMPAKPVKSEQAELFPALPTGGAEYYPNHPGYKREGTSQDAAESIKSRAITLRAQVFEILQEGAYTADEVAAKLGESVLSIRPRLSELVGKDQILMTELRRYNNSGKLASVWKAA